MQVDILVDSHRGISEILGQTTALLHNIVPPEELRDIITLIFRELAMRLSGGRAEERPGFEDATIYELRLALYRTASELVILQVDTTSQFNKDVVA